MSNPFSAYHSFTFAILSDNIFIIDLSEFSVVFNEKCYYNKMKAKKKHRM